MMNVWLLMPPRCPPLRRRVASCQRTPPVTRPRGTRHSVSAVMDRTERSSPRLEVRDRRRAPSCSGRVRPDLLLDPGEHRRHPAQPQRAHRLAEPERDVEVVGHGQDVGGGLTVETRVHDRREAPAWSGPRAVPRRTGAHVPRRRPRPPGTAATGTRAPAPSSRPRRRSARGRPGSSCDSSSSSCNRSLGPTAEKSSTSSASASGEFSHARTWATGTRTALPHSVQLPS